jgi:hypothetical protein
LLFCLYDLCAPIVDPNDGIGLREGFRSMRDHDDEFYIGLFLQIGQQSALIDAVKG